MTAEYTRYGQDLILLKRFKQCYANFNADSLDQLADLYTADIEFVDPVHKINGLLALKRYFKNQIASINYCRFRYISELFGEDKAFIRWEMDFSHPKIAKGKELILPGMTEIHFAHSIYYHCDSYDLGGMLYEHLPVLGFAVKSIKRQLQ